MGKHLSPIQGLALELCMIADQRDKALDSARALKLALVSHDPATYLPHFFGDRSVSDEPTPVETSVEPDFNPADPTATEGEWRFTESVDPSEAEAILADMLAQPSGVLIAPDGPEEGWK